MRLQEVVADTNRFEDSERTALNENVLGLTSQSEVKGLLRKEFGTGDLQVHHRGIPLPRIPDGSICRDVSKFVLKQQEVPQEGVPRLVTFGG